jgi:hypothetical protein
MRSRSQDTISALSKSPAERASEVEARAPRWLDAASWTWMRGQFFGGLPTDLDAQAAFMYLVTLTRTQAAAERAFDRLIEAHAYNEKADREHRPSVGIDAKLRIGGETHAFLVSAHLFWSTFDVMRRQLPTSELKEAWKVHRMVADQTGKARDHIEHLPERIKKGRTRKPVMEKDVFREAVGVFDGTLLTFGDETFDLRQIRDSIRRVEEKVAPKLEERLTVKFSVKVGPPSEADANEPDSTGDLATSPS